MSGVAKSLQAFQGPGKIIPVRISLDDKDSTQEIEVPIRLILVISLHQVKKIMEDQQTALGRPMPNLTGRENEVLNGILESKDNKTIASDLNLSVRTVKFYVSALLVKFGVKTRFELRDVICGKVIVTT